jgi:hypothetical protein
MGVDEAATEERMQAGPQDNTTKELPLRWLELLEPVTQAQKKVSAIRVPAADRPPVFASSAQVSS